MSLKENEVQFLREQLRCSFKDVDKFFPHCIQEAVDLLSLQGVRDYLDGASMVCMIGRGFEPVLTYLEEMPMVAKRLGEETLTMVSDAVWKMSRTPNGNSISPFLQTIGEASRRLGSKEQLEHYFKVIFEMMERTTGSIHGVHTTIPSPGLPYLLYQIPGLLNTLSLEGINNWIDNGIRNYGNHPERQIDYFSLQSADSRAMLQRERHGTLFIDNERKLNLYLQCLWEDKDHLVPYTFGLEKQADLRPYFDEFGVRIPDVYDDLNGVNGIDRYRALLAHIAAHRKWSTEMFADNYSPLQRMAIEIFEDCRVDYLAIKKYPGLKKLFLALHPQPGENDCDPEKSSCIRHRLTMFSYAALDQNHNYTNKDLLEFVEKFHTLMQQDNHTTKDAASLAISYIARTRRQKDQAASMYFSNTQIDFHDDNRHLWRYIEMSDEEEMFEDLNRRQEQDDELDKLPPRHYHEWDYNTKTYKADWVSLYETLHPSGDAEYIEALLSKHGALIKKLKRILDLLKPQQYVRVRYQEDGSELDLDVAIRSLIDFKGGCNPDPRINMSHKHDGRDIAVFLLLDLSASLADIPDGCQQSLLQLSQEAVALLSMAIEGLGDKFAIAGFSSNTRHEVRYQHIKGYSEHWDDTVKSRLAAMEAGYSTRMGAALRHAAHYIGTQNSDKKLLLVLTDGEPSDIDIDDPRLLIEDAHKAVQELDQEGIYTYCINLDPNADEYVGDIFGNQYSVIDNVEKLPEKLPQLFMALTK